MKRLFLLRENSTCRAITARDYVPLNVNARMSSGTKRQLRGYRARENVDVSFSFIYFQKPGKQFAFSRNCPQRSLARARALGTSVNLENRKERRSSRFDLQSRRRRRFLQTRSVQLVFPFIYPTNPMQLRGSQQIRSTLRTSRTEPNGAIRRERFVPRPSDDFSGITRELQSSRRVLAGIAFGTRCSFRRGRLPRPRQHLAAVPRISRYSG